MTWGDIFISAGMDNVSSYLPGLFNETPKLKSLVEKVKNYNPEIKEWLQNRPPIGGFTAPFE